MRAVIVAPDRPQPVIEGITEIRTITQMRQYLMKRNVPVEELGKLLLGPPKVVDHDDPEEIKKIYGETASS